MLLKHSIWSQAARWFVFIWFAGGGIGHFLFTDFFLSITPAWVPYPREVVYFSGVLELLGAAGLWFSAVRPWAAWGLFGLTLAVSNANVVMSLHPERFPQFPEPLLHARLLLQVFLLYFIVRVARGK